MPRGSPQVSPAEEAAGSLVPGVIATLVRTGFMPLASPSSPVLLAMASRWDEQRRRHRRRRAPWPAGAPAPPAPAAHVSSGVPAEAARSATPRRRLSAVSDAQLDLAAGKMRLDGGQGDVQFGGDLGVGPADRDQPHDIQFAFGQGGLRLDGVLAFHRQWLGGGSALRRGQVPQQSDRDRGRDQGAASRRGADRLGEKGRPGVLRSGGNRSLRRAAPRTRTRPGRRW